MAGLKKADFPESVRGLVDKPKTELLNIIARKDDVERRLTTENTNFKKKIDELNTTILEQSACITKNNKTLEETGIYLDMANDEITKLHKNFSNCFITLAVVIIILVVVLFHFL